MFYSNQNDRATGLKQPLRLKRVGAGLPLPFFAAALMSHSPDFAMAMLFPAFFFAMLQGGPAIAIVQEVAGPSIRAVTVSIYLVVVSLISGFGAQLIGLLSDALPISRGCSPLGLAMFILAAAFSTCSALFFLWGARFLAHDLA